MDSVDCQQQGGKFSLHSFNACLPLCNLCCCRPLSLSCQILASSPDVVQSVCGPGADIGDSAEYGEISAMCGDSRSRSRLLYFNPVASP